MLRLFAAVLLGAVPACLLAPPPPGAGGDAGLDGGGTGDGGGDGGPPCPCTGAVDQLPVAMVVPATTDGLPDRLVRAGTCDGRVQLLVFDPGTAVGGELDPRCPTAVVPDLVLAGSDGSGTVRALGTFRPGHAAVVIDGPGAGTRVVSVNLTTGEIQPLTASAEALGAGTAYVASVPSANALLYGADTTVWLADLTAAAPAVVATSLPAVVAAPQTTGSANTWALTGHLGDYQAVLDFAEPPTPPSPLPAPCANGECTMIGHANELATEALGEIASYAISRGGLLTVTVRGTATLGRGVLDLQLPASATVLDVAIAKDADQASWIAVLDDRGMVHAARLTIGGATVTTAPFVSTALPDALDPSARVVVGRLGPTLRIYVLSGAAGAAQHAVCLQPDTSALGLCAP